MPIERSAREVLFGTPVVSHQIQKYMAQRKACTITDLRADFYDISKALFFHYLQPYIKVRAEERRGTGHVYRQPSE